MYKRLLLLTLILSSFQAFAYKITIKINGSPKTKFLLGYYYGDKQYIKDSATSDASGRIIFSGEEKLQGGIYLIASEDKALLFDFIVSEQVFYLETDTVDYSGHMKVKGSVENTAFFEYTKFTAKIGQEMAPYEKALKEARDNNDTAAIRTTKEKMAAIEKRLSEYRLNMTQKQPTLLISKVFKMMRDVSIPEAPILPNGRKDSTFAYFYYRNHYFDNFDFADDRIVYTPVFHGRLEYYMTKVIPQIPDSINKAADMVIAKALKSKEVSKWCIYWITNHYETSQFMGMDAVFVHMAKNYYSDSTKTFWVDETLRYKIMDRVSNLENNLLGLTAPNLIMPDTGWTMRELHKIKARYTMVIFWDANCGRCKEEIPRLKELYAKLNKEHMFEGGRYFEVYAISMTNIAEEWKKFVADNNLKWVNVSDLYNNTRYRKLYDVYSTPVIYLLGENKKILAKRLSVEQVADFIEKGLE